MPRVLEVVRAAAPRCASTERALGTRANAFYYCVTAPSATATEEVRSDDVLMVPHDGDVVTVTVDVVRPEDGHVWRRVVALDTGAVLQAHDDVASVEAPVSMTLEALSPDVHAMSESIMAHVARLDRPTTGRGYWHVVAYAAAADATAQPSHPSHTWITMDEHLDATMATPVPPVAERVHDLMRRCDRARGECVVWVDWRDAATHATLCHDVAIVVCS